MSRDALLALMRDRLGLDPATLGERVLDDACADARRRLGLADDAALYRRVLLDADAFADCAESFTVPESWFFRAAEQFDDLVRWARAWPKRRPFRVLCLPSAAGEEAWSAAIALVEAGLAPTEFSVLGIDVSRAAVRRAEEGRYRRSAFRGAPPPAAWLHPTADGLWEVDPLLRRAVRFRVGNGLDPLLLAAEDRFDAVFCRNLLIYLHGGARRQLLQALLAATRTPALLLAGQAEVLAGLDERLQPLPGGSPLTFRYDGDIAPVRAPVPVGAWPLTVDAPRPPLPVAKAKAPPSAPLVAAAAPAPPVAAAIATDVADPVAEAHRLADAGRVAEARAACVAHLARHPADIAALYLLGLVESAAGDVDAAERAFTRVLYVDREHLDALEQRIALAERRGDRAHADELRARATRLRRRRDQREAST